MAESNLLHSRRLHRLEIVSTQPSEYKYLWRGGAVTEKPYAMQIATFITL